MLDCDAWTTKGDAGLENRQIAAAFRELADLLEIAGEDRFRVSAYRRASETIRHEPRPLAALAYLFRVKGTVC